VVLESNEWQIKTWVTVEEEKEGEEDRLRGTGHNVLGRELTPLSLLGLIEEKLRVQAPPELVVLVNALTTDGKFHRFHRTLGSPAATEDGAVTITGADTRRGKEFDVHFADQVTVARNRDGHAAVVGRGTVDSLFDVFHREVRVSLVHSLEESHLGVPREVDVLSAVRNQLHETTSHFFCTVQQYFFFGISPLFIAVRKNRL